MQYKTDSLSLILKFRPDIAEEIEPCVMLSKPPLISFNGALFHVTSGQEYAKNVSIKATTALKQTVWYQLVDETWETCEHKSGSTSSWKVKQISNSIFDKALLRKGFELLVQLLTWPQISDQVTPCNQKTRNSKKWYHATRGKNAQHCKWFWRHTMTAYDLPFWRAEQESCGETRAVIAQDQVLLSAIYRALICTWPFSVLVIHERGERPRALCARVSRFALCPSNPPVLQARIKLTNDPRSFWSWCIKGAE